MCAIVFWYFMGTKYEKNKRFTPLTPLISVCLFLQSSPNETNSNIESCRLQKPVLFSNSAVLDEVPSTPRLPRPHVWFWADVWAAELNWQHWVERVGRKALKSNRGDLLRGFSPSCPGVTSCTHVRETGSRCGGDAVAELWLPGGKEVSRGCRHFAPSAEAPHTSSCALGFFAFLEFMWFLLLSFHKI